MPLELICAMYSSPVQSGLTCTFYGFPHLWGGPGTCTALCMRVQDRPRLNLLRERDGCRMRNSLWRYLSVEPKHMNSIISKITKHVDVLKLFVRIAFRTVGLQQL